MNVPLNATGALASAGGANAVDMSFIGDIEHGTVCAIMPFMCSGSNPITGYIASAIEGVLRSVLNPLIQVVAGTLGIAAGALMAAFGIYTIMQSTQTGQKLSQLGGGAARTGIMAVAPESAPLVAATSSERVAARKGQTSRMLMQGRTQQISQTAAARSAQSAQLGQQRLQQETVKNQLKMQSMQYAEYLRRSRPPAGKRG
jgi:hypothetical protein